MTDIAEDAKLSREDIGEQRQDDEEREMVAAAISGDTQAFAWLYDRYLDRIYRHVYYRVGHQSDAEDLTQQVFMQAWRAIRRYRQTDVPFLSWLFTITHNLIVSFYRRSKSQQYLEIDMASDQPAISPEQVVEAGEREAVVRRAILRLRPDQQQVVLLRFVENLSHTAVRVLQHRALHELRRILDKENVVWLR
jgi:RNA polymerase sigma-70 factor (ECF subfamily)